MVLQKPDSLVKLTQGAPSLGDLSATNVSGINSVTSFAQLGSGAAVAAVPEPATSAMMLVGFGGMGMAMRRNRSKSAAVMQIA